MFDVDCVGSEMDLLDCSHSSRYTSCTNSRSIAVRCNSTCRHGDIKSVGGVKPSEGRVEVCIHGDWMTVCDDSLSTSDIQVVCKQLGYTSNSGKWSINNNCITSIAW